ncbi:unnamed protein product, partial [Brassica rapa subsp. narinosa]
MDPKTMRLKIADLGLARAFTLPMKKYTHELIISILTLWYRAPEVLLGATHYSTAVDMWSVGCVFGTFYSLQYQYLLIKTTETNIVSLTLTAELVTNQAILAGDSELQRPHHHHHSHLNFLSRLEKF